MIYIYILCIIYIYIYIYMYIYICIYIYIIIYIIIYASYMRIYIGSPQENRLLTSLCVSRGLRNSLPRCSSMIRKSRQKTSWSSQSARGKSPAWTLKHPTSSNLQDCSTSGNVMVGCNHFCVKSQELPVLHMLRSSPKPVHCCGFLQQKQLMRCRHHHHYQHSRVLRASHYADSQGAVFPHELVAGFPPTASSSEALSVAHINQENCLVKSVEYLQFVCLHCMRSTMNLSATLMTSCMHR